MFNYLTYIEGLSLETSVPFSRGGKAGTEWPRLNRFCPDDWCQITSSPSRSDTSLRWTARTVSKVSCLLDPNSLHLSKNNTAWKLLPRSKCNWGGTSKRKINSTTVFTCWSCSGYSSIHFMKWSPTIRTYLFLLQEAGTGPNTSTVALFKGSSTNRWESFSDHVRRLCYGLVSWRLWRQNSMKMEALNFLVFDEFAANPALLRYLI